MSKYLSRHGRSPFIPIPLFSQAATITLNLGGIIYLENQVLYSTSTQLVNSNVVKPEDY